MPYFYFHAVAFYFNTSEDELQSPLLVLWKHWTFSMAKILTTDLIKNVTSLNELCNLGVQSESKLLWNHLQKWLKVTNTKLCLVFVTLRLTLIHAAFCHGHWGLIIVSGFPESSGSVAWKERSCMQTAKQSLITSVNSLGHDFCVWKGVSFKDQSVCGQTETQSSHSECTY